MKRLYHFTDDRSASAIRDSGELRPAHHHVLGEHFVWLTSASHPNAHALGFARRSRMAVRFAVETDLAVPWLDIRDRWSPQMIQMLEGSPGAKPELWYVATNPIPVTS